MIGKKTILQILNQGTEFSKNPTAFLLLLLIQYIVS